MSISLHRSQSSSYSIASSGEVLVACQPLAAPTEETEVTEHPGRSDEVLLARLRSGDETAFADLVDSLHGRLIRLARTFTRSAVLAEDVAQETWLAVIRGLRGFEGRSSLQTWIFSILV